MAATDGPALREVLGDRATFVPAGDMTALIEAAQRAERPAPPPPRWSWEDAARATWEVYARAAAEADAEPASRPAEPAAPRPAEGLEAGGPAGC